MRLLVLLRFVPDRPWRLSSWLGLRPYLHFRITTAYGEHWWRCWRRLPRDFWEYLGWAYGRRVW